MSNRRRPQLKQEVNIKMSRYVTLCIGFIKQFYHYLTIYLFLKKYQMGSIKEYVINFA